MSGTPVPIGPFIGGLNTLSDPGAIGDNELVVCTNFEVDPDGALKTRPPFVLLPGNSDYPSPNGFRLLGYYTVNGTTYIIASGGGQTMYLNGSTWTVITNTIAASAVQQFNGTLYVVAPYGSGNPGGTWNGTAFTADSTMPKGSAIVSYKGRLWVATTDTTMQYSAVTQDTNFWTVGSTYGGTLKIGLGDGQTNIALLVLSNVILIFRTNSIWQFSYSSGDPSYGSQAVLVPDVGLAASDALVVFEGTAYFMFDGKAYVLNGATAQQINQNVPFIATLRAGSYLPFAVSVVGRRIVFTYYDTLYVWNLRSHTWTTWRTPTYTGIGKFLQVSGAAISDLLVYVTHSNFTNSSNQRTLRFTDGYTSDTEPQYTATMTTKTFDYATPAQFKRLFYWGIDAIFKSSLIGSVTPELFSSRVTWGQMLKTTYGQALKYTWGQSAQASQNTATTVTPDAGGTTPVRKFVKLGRSMRARRLIYQVQIPVDGSIATSPAKIFGMETVVGVKQIVSKQIS